MKKVSDHSSPDESILHGSTSSNYARHPLVSTLFWLWNRFQPNPCEDHRSDTAIRSPKSASGGELGLMWNEEYGGHLDLYAEYFQDLKDRNPLYLKTSSLDGSGNKDTGSSSPFATPSPAWGWFTPITPPRDSFLGPGMGTPSSNLSPHRDSLKKTANAVTISLSIPPKAPLREK